MYEVEGPKNETIGYSCSSRRAIEDVVFEGRTTTIALKMMEVL